MIRWSPTLPPHHAEITALREVARAIHWDACGKQQQDGHYAALGIVNEKIRSLGGVEFGA
jgi:hypothetical protein